MTDEELIKTLKITAGDRVLDIGGSLKQHQLIKVDTLVDLYHPKDAPYWPSELKAKHFVKLDIEREKLPFKDKEFDICFCTHVLEDLFNPFLVLDEMARVAKRGYIAAPSRGKDMEFDHFNLTDWATGARRQPGQAHHHWFFENLDNQLVLTPKIYPILYTSEFQIISWAGEEECNYFWKDEISFRVFQRINMHAVVKNYQDFVLENKKHIKTGPILFFVDSPWYIIKEWAKYFLRH